MVYNRQVRRHSLVVKPQLPKLMLRVRFPLPAPNKNRGHESALCSYLQPVYRIRTPPSGKAAWLHLRRICERCKTPAGANMGSDSRCHVSPLVHLEQTFTDSEPHQAAKPLGYICAGHANDVKRPLAQIWVLIPVVFYHTDPAVGASSPTN